MRKRLQLARMLTLTRTTALATSLAFLPTVLLVFSAAPRVWAADGEDSPQLITPTDEHGHKVYVNEPAPARARRSDSQTSEAPQPRRPSLVYWSSKEDRWKPVPSANTASMRAARSAAAEVSQYQASQYEGGHYARDSAQSANAKILSANALGHPASQEEIDSSIVMAAARHNVDPNLVRAVVKVESNFNSNAVSRKGAMGLMQLMPSTARELKVRNPFDPDQNVDAGVRHLKQLLENYGGDVNLTLAAYNAGSGAVARSAGVPHFAETQNYVRRITNLYYGGFDLSPSGPRHDPVRVQRDARGVLYMTNTD
jgi:soluble lytic murein transglycosylase-like protein